MEVKEEKVFIVREASCGPVSKMCIQIEHEHSSISQLPEVVDSYRDFIDGRQGSSVVRICMVPATPKYS